MGAKVRGGGQKTNACIRYRSFRIKVIHRSVKCGDARLYVKGNGKKEDLAPWEQSGVRPVHGGCRGCARPSRGRKVQARP